MPIIKSAKKRVRTARKASVRNVKTKRALREAIKNLQNALNTDAKKAPEAFKEVQSALDKAVKKGVMHKNKASRKKSQLAVSLKNSGVKAAKKAPPKTTSKKSAPKTK